MERISAAERAVLTSRGVILAGDSMFYIDAADKANAGIAMDAQPTLFTSPNSGIPAFLTNVIDPEVIRVIFAPMYMADIMGGEAKKGDWVTKTMQFPVVESAGQIASYGDYSNNGNTDANINFVPRTSYEYQTFSRWGERELDFYALAKLNYKSELDMSAALIFAKFQNYSYAFGVAGLANYGLLNDPSLPAPITPSVKAAGGTSWTNATAQEIYGDFLALFYQLQLQLGGQIQMTDTITVALSPLRAVALAKVSQFNVTARATIEANFPNMTIKVAPEYTTPAGELMQMLLPTFEGVQTAYPAYTEKMRMHAVIPDASSWKQKKSGGTWGAIVRRPIAIASELGI